MRYVRPKSLTWWSGAASIVFGVALAAKPELQSLSEFAAIFAALLGSGDPSPATFVLAGLGLIGIREKLERLG